MYIQEWLQLGKMYKKCSQIYQTVKITEKGETEKKVF